MNVQEAYEYGRQMYHEGMDLSQIPEHFSAVEKEVCADAYENMSSTEHFDYLNEEVESIVFEEDNYKELNFN